MARVPAIERLAVPADGVQFLAASDAKAPRSYSMLGYTGEAFDRWYGRSVIDVQGMELAPTLPGFCEHSRDQRVCFGTGEIKGGALHVKGTLLDNEHANAMARDADQGFPFQASIGVSYLRVEEVKAGDSKQVNGRKFDGPGYVVTKSKVFECSPVSLGADGKTRTDFMAAPKDGPTIEVASTEKENHHMADQAQIDAAKQEALAADRARAKAITEALKDHPGIALLAIQEGLSLAEAKAKLAEALMAEVAAQKAKIEKLERAAANPAVAFAAGKREETLGNPPTDDDLTHLPPEERAPKEFARDAALRKEFKGAGGVKAYEAYLRAEADGRVKVLEPLHGKYGEALK